MWPTTGLGELARPRRQAGVHPFRSLSKPNTDLRTSRSALVTLTAQRKVPRIIETGQFVALMRSVYILS